MKEHCETCSMRAVRETRDAQGVTHYYCQHCGPQERTADEQERLSRPRDYALFALIISSILFEATLLSASGALGPFGPVSWMRAFMASFFITFAGFKFIDLRGFAASFVNYDLIASRIPAYGLLYPFLEAGLGIGYLLAPGDLLNAATLVLMSIGALGVLKQLRSGRRIRCACLGTYIKLPLSTISLTEDLVMGAMALAALLLHV